MASLEEASGVELLQPDVRKLQRSILDGNWQDAGRALLRLPLEQLTRQGCWFIIMQHKFLETIIDPTNSLETRIACLRSKAQVALPFYTASANMPFPNATLHWLKCRRGMLLRIFDVQRTSVPQLLTQQQPKGSTNAPHF